MKENKKVLISIVIFVIASLIPISHTYATIFENLAWQSLAKENAELHLSATPVIGIKSDTFFKKENIEFGPSYHWMKTIQLLGYPLLGNLGGEGHGAGFVAQCMKPKLHFGKSWVSTKAEINKAVEKTKSYHGNTYTIGGVFPFSQTAAEAAGYGMMLLDLQAKQNQWTSEVKSYAGVDDLKTIRLEKQNISQDTKELLYGVFGITNYYHISLLGNTNLIKQNAVWKVIQEYERNKSYIQSHGYDESIYSPAIYKASKYFKEKWTEGTMKKDTVNLKGTSVKATVSVNNTDPKNTKYLVGPFKVEYDYYKSTPITATEGTNDIDIIKGSTLVKYRFSWVKEYRFYDQNGNTIDNVRITDVSGNITYETIPRNLDFYLEIDYKDTRDKKISEINVDVTVEFFSGLNKQQDIEYYKQIKEKWNVTNFFGLPNVKITDASSGLAFVIPYIDVSIYFSTYTYETYPFLENKALPENEQDYQPIINEPIVDMETKTEKTTLKCYIDASEMEIAGYVWDDSSTEGKNQNINGKKDDDEKGMPGVVVTLYESNGTLAQLASGKIRTFTSSNAIAGKALSTNPTITDDNGYYSFRGVDASKKYYVKYTYNGMDCEATTKKYEYQNASSDDEIIEYYYNTDEWNNASKGSEVASERDKLNNKFRTVGSTPNNYETTAIFSGDYLSSDNGKTYNKVYIAKDLEELKEEIYKKSISKLADNGIISGITNGILGDLSGITGLLFNNTDNYIKSVYSAVASEHGNDNEIKRQLQFIYDSKIDAYSGYGNAEGGSNILRNYMKNNGEYYPVYDKIKLTKNIPTILGNFVDNQLTANHPKCENGYWYIYVGQLNIGMGLIPRATTTLNLREDLVETVVSINGKDETYKYGTLSDSTLDLSDSDAFAKVLSSTMLMGGYSQTISPDDYNYNTSSSELRNGTATYEENYAKMQIYAKYKITVKNVSVIPTAVNELVTYFNRTYLSYNDLYITTQDKKLLGISGYKTISSTKKELNNVTTTNTSRYGIKSQTGLVPFADLYINLGENGVMLETNDSVTVYVTYQMGGNSIKDPIKYSCIFGIDNSAQHILQQTLGKGQKINIVTYTEINGFSTYYNKAKDLLTHPVLCGIATTYEYLDNNDMPVYYRAAGVMDAYSVPGNLDTTQIAQVVPKEKDWDKAPTLILGSPDEHRKLSGTVWETSEFSNYYLENENEYPKFNNNQKISNLTVELIEIKDDEQYVRAVTTTNEGGEYTFTGYIPGNYVVRFVYGDKILYSQNQSDVMNGGEYNYPYNGEFYQSAKANPNTNNGGVLGNTRFWYADNEGTRYSDAYDEAKIRYDINTKFNNLPDHNGYVYSEAVDTIKNPRDYMVYSYTALMEFYPEKAKYDTGLVQLPSYSITNVDFALTPRTKTKLNITKEVASVRLVLQNGTILFDATPQTIREQGVPGVVQVNRGNTISISMTNELLNGATIEITYLITVKNDSDYDSVTYYKNSSGNVIALGLYEESYDKLVAYEKNYSEIPLLLNTIIVTGRDKIRTYANEEFITNTNDGNKISVIDAGRTSLEQYASRTIEETTTSPTMIADLVSSNLNFSHTDATGRTINNGWEIYEGTKKTFIGKYYSQKSEQLEMAPTGINDIDTTEVYNINTIVMATSGNQLIEKKLKHGEQSTAYITLSKVVSTENNLTDTKSYENSVRIVQVNNTVSRIQDMDNTDTSIRLKHTTESVIITEPTGANRGYMLINIALISIIILASGTILIKKTVLK